MTHFAKLSNVKAKAWKPTEKVYKTFDGQGLFLEARPNSNKKWRLKYRFNGAEQRASLGGYPAVSLKEASLVSSSHFPYFYSNSLRLA